MRFRQEIYPLLRHDQSERGAAWGSAIQGLLGAEAEITKEAKGSVKRRRFAGLAKPFTRSEDPARAIPEYVRIANRGCVGLNAFDGWAAGLGDRTLKKQYAKPTLAKREKLAAISAVTAAPASAPDR